MIGNYFLVTRVLIRRVKMSYSRWGTSRWYTYWAINEKENYDTAEFCICGLVSFSAKQLRENIDRCLSTILSKDKEATNEEMDELANYICRFLNEVDKEYLK